MPQVHVHRSLPDQDANEVFRRLSDFGKYPLHCREVREVRVREAEPGVLHVDWEVNLRGGVVRWTDANQLNSHERTIIFRQLDGDLKRFEGLWRVTPSAEGAEVVFDAEFDLGLSLLGDMLSGVAKRALRSNIESMLDGLFAKSSASA